MVNLSGIYGLSSKGRLHLLGIDALVVDRRVVCHVEPVRIAGDSLQEGRASGPGRTKDSHHFTTVYNTLQVAQYVDPVLTLAKQLPGHIPSLEKDVSNCLLKVHFGTVSIDVEISERHAGRLRRVAMEGVSSAFEE